jgi:hypothetical protein
MYTTTQAKFEHKLPEFFPLLYSSCADSKIVRASV